MKKQAARIKLSDELFGKLYLAVKGIGRLQEVRRGIFFFHLWTEAELKYFGEEVK